MQKTIEELREFAEWLHVREMDQHRSAQDAKLQADTLHEARMEAVMRADAFERKLKREAEGDANA
jgi:membrane protein involved in colicin uptake